MKSKISVLFIICLMSLSSCATVFGGRVTTAQRTKPKEGEPARKVRTVALIADIVLFLPGLIVDFATNAIYRPDQSSKEPAPQASK